jgi:electron transport complex protein RnfD
MSAERVLDIRTSPHIAVGRSVDAIMWSVVLALAPTLAWSIYAFGLSAALVVGVAVASCVVTEHLGSLRASHGTTVGDGSVVVTGLLLGLSLPPALPLWMVAVAGVAGVAIGKLLFGGLGGNPFNPALVGRAFVQAAFPVALTTWTAPLATDRFSALPSSTLTLPFAKPVYDAMSGATPLSAWKFGGDVAATRDLALGLTSGSTGETCALFILLGGLFLVARGIMSWRIPAAVLLTVALLTLALDLAGVPGVPPPDFMIFSGGLMLGATFMATDLVASPMTHAGLWLYGALIGALVVAIRMWGGMPEGVMYAILIGNAVSPHIDRAIRPRVYGTARLRRAEPPGEAHP